MNFSEHECPCKEEFYSFSPIMTMDEAKNITEFLGQAYNNIYTSTKITVSHFVLSQSPNPEETCYYGFVEGYDVDMIEETKIAFRLVILISFMVFLHVLIPNLTVLSLPRLLITAILSISASVILLMVVSSCRKPSRII